MLSTVVYKTKALIGQVSRFIQQEEHDIGIKKVPHADYRFVNSATICMSSCLSSGCKGFHPLRLAYLLALSSLPYLLSESFGFVATVLILSFIIDDGAKIRNNYEFQNINKGMIHN